MNIDNLILGDNTKLCCDDDWWLMTDSMIELNWVMSIHVLRVKYREVVISKWSSKGVVNIRLTNGHKRPFWLKNILAINSKFVGRKVWFEDFEPSRTIGSNGYFWVDENSEFLKLVGGKILQSHVIFVIYHPSIYSIM